MLSYQPPDIQWSSASGIIIPGGRYYHLGSRSKGQYNSFFRRANYWDTSNPFTFTIASGMSGLLDNSFLNNNWYSIFMLGESDFLALPFFRIYSLDYNVSFTGKTTLILGSQSVAYWDTQVEETSYVNTNDAWNNYCFRQWPNDMRTLLDSSPIYTVEDTIEGTSDKITINGDHTGGTGLSSGQMMQLLPPNDIPYLYLGTIRKDSSGNIVRFIKTGWTYAWASWYPILPTFGLTAGNSYIYCVPPNATKVRFSHYIGDDDTNYSYGQVAWFFSGDSEDTRSSTYFMSTNTQTLVNYYNYRTQYKRSRQSMEMNITNNQCIRNSFARYDAEWLAPEFAMINVYGWSE